MLNHKTKRSKPLNSLIVLLVTLAIVDKVDLQFANFQVISNKNVTDQDCGPFLKISVRIIDKLLCLSFCPRFDCNLVSFDTNINQCRIFNVSLNVLQQTGLSFSNAPGINLYFSKPFLIKAFNGSLRSIIKIHSDRVNNVIKLSTGGLASASFDESIKFFNLDGTVTRSIFPKSSWITVLIEIPNGKLVSGSYAGVVHIWNIYDGSSVRNLTGHTQWVNTLLYIPSISRLATGSVEWTIKIWDPSNGALINTLTSHTNVIVSLILLPNGDMASASMDNCIKIWDVTNFNCKNTISLVSSSTAYKTMLRLQNGNVATGDSDSNIIIWRPIDAMLIQKLVGHTLQILSLAQLPNGDLASGSSDQTIRIWDLNTGITKMILNRHLGSITGLISLDSGELISSSTDSNIFVWV